MRCLDYSQMECLVKLGFLESEDENISVEEVLNWLPESVEFDGAVIKSFLEISRCKGKWVVVYDYDDDHYYKSVDESLLNAAFETLVWCIKNNYIVKGGEL